MFGYSISDHIYRSVSDVWSMPLIFAQQCYLSPVVAVDSLFEEGRVSSRTRLGRRGLSLLDVGGQPAKFDKEDEVVIVGRDFVFALGAGCRLEVPWSKLD